MCMMPVLVVDTSALCIMPWSSLYREVLVIESHCLLFLLAVVTWLDQDYSESSMPMMGRSRDQVLFEIEPRCI
jgi:hypothetical protein